MSTSKKITAYKGLYKNYTVFCNEFYDEVYNETYSQAQTINIELQPYEPVQCTYCINEDGPISIIIPKFNSLPSNKQSSFIGGEFALVNDMSYLYVDNVIKDDQHKILLAPIVNEDGYIDDGSEQTLNIYASPYDDQRVIITLSEQLNNTNVLNEYRWISSITIPQHSIYDITYNSINYNYVITSNGIYGGEPDKSNISVKSEQDSENVFKSFTETKSDKWSPDSDAILFIDTKYQYVKFSKIKFWFSNDDYENQNYPQISNIYFSDDDVNWSASQTLLFDYFEDEEDGKTYTFVRQTTNKYGRYIKIEFKKRETQSSLNVGHIIELSGQYNSYQIIE